MKKRNIFSKFQLFLFLFILSISGFSQSISGTVLDRETNETVAFAAVQIGDSYGVITNNEGNFEIDTSRFSPNDSLVFTYLGYKRHAVAIKDFTDKKVFLVPDINTLSEIYLIDRNLDPMTIMGKVQENLSKNHPKQNEKFSVFQRTKENYKTDNSEFAIKKADFVSKKIVKDVNSELALLIQNSKGKSSNIYFDTYFEIYKNEKDSLKLDIKKGTKLINLERNTSTDNLQNKAFATIGAKLESSNSFKLRSGIIPISDSVDLKRTFNASKKADTLNIKDKNREFSNHLSDFGFGKNSDFSFITDYKKYNFTIDKAFSYNDELVYVLHFEPNKGSANYSGELYISADTYAVLKAKYKLADGKRGDKINLKLLLGIKYEELNREVLVIFNRNENSTYSLKYLKTNIEQYIYLNRSFTFIENNKDRKDRMKLKLDILSEGINKTENEILVIDSQPLSMAGFNKINQKTKTSVQTIEKYDPTIWSPYTIISPNQAIKDFEN